MDATLLEKENIEVVSTRLPYTLKFQVRTSINDFVKWSQEYKDELNQKLYESGAILFKNVDINSVDDFELTIKPLFENPITYFDGFSPRRKIASNTYTSTEYDADFFITLHNELSFSSTWPTKLFFGCLVPPKDRGETVIVDGRSILNKLDKPLLKELEDKGVKYVRNLHGGEGPGPSWQETYETESKEEVEKFFYKNGVTYEWKDDGGLKVTQIRPATILHPVTKEKVWFNQVDQFHPSQFEDEIYETLMMMFEREEDLPMYGSFGDGSKISVDKIRSIHKVFEENMILNKWEQGDILVVDNMLVCHGRMPYSGDRKIVVSMCK
ncbi:MAG: alpha-ketoglutarate-dependent taurine dioxygenase [Cyclobacteriaceae bacterium]|jgi:alpha-ketoglutarate-dependent taurine dioxygenase